MEIIRKNADLRFLTNDELKSINGGTPFIVVVALFFLLGVALGLNADIPPSE